jgi:hypothetical protein
MVLRLLGPGIWTAGKKGLFDTQGAEGDVEAGLVDE